MKFGYLQSKFLLFRLSSSYTALSPSRVITILVTHSHSSTFSTTTGSGSSFGSGSSHSSSRRPHHDEESRSVKVSVWWDFENCNLTVGANVSKLAQSITTAIRNSGIKGPITIKAFGDVIQINKSNQDALTATGISLIHVPHGSQGGKNSADISLITDLLCWVSQNPPPAHLFLISSDKEFASVLHRLRMSNYNILLASKSSAPGVLYSAASIMWDWDALVKGENVTGKHFNQPPDGPYNSWYGHYRIPLLDPFASPTIEQSSCVKNEKLSECSSNLASVNHRPVPKEVVSKIRLILSLYPNGIPITELRSELFRSNVAVDKDFYGHKKFSRFLKSIPDILQINTAIDSLCMISAVTENTMPDSSPGLSSAVDQKVKEKETTNASSPKLISDVELDYESRRDDSLGKKQQNVTDEKHLKEESSENSKGTILVSQKDAKVNDQPMEMNQVALISVSDSSIEDGFFQKLKRVWYGLTCVESEHLPENKNVSGSGDNDKVDTDLKSSSQVVNPLSQISPSFAGESTEEVKAGTDEVGNNDKNVSPGIFSQLLKSFELWGRNTGLSNQNMVDVDSQEHDIFAKDSFWRDVESFINSPRGFAIVSHSRTREAMAKNLQKEGPSCLRQLNESSMLHLVNLLISHKKWIEENPSSSLPFSIIKGSSSIPGHSHVSNGLSSIFADCSKSQWQKQESEKRCKNIAHAGVSVGYKSNAIADCQKLIKNKKEDDSDLSFEELGPVSETTTKLLTKKLPMYEPSLSEDEDSGSERENPKKKKKVKNGEDIESSLLQILDSYYTNKDGEVKKEKPEERKLVGNSRKQKHGKTYSFVKDSEV